MPRARPRFGYRNAFMSGLVTASAQTTALPATGLQNPRGGPSKALQTPNGVTELAISLDTLNAIDLRDFGVFRTNLTREAAVRIRADLWAELLADPQVLPTDTSAGATRGTNLTRIGSVVMDDGSAGTVYESSSTSNSSVGATVALRPGRYRVQLKAQRISGSGGVGRLLGARYWQAGQLRTVNVLMTELAASGVATYQAEIVNDLATNVTMVFLGETGPMGQVAIGSGLLTPLPALDSGVLPGPVPGFAQVPWGAPAAISARYVRIDISDPTNPDGFLNVPLAYAGSSWELAIGLAPDSAPTPERRSTIRETRGGGQTVEPLFYRRGWDLSHKGALDSEVWGQIDQLDRAAYRGENILLFPNPLGDLYREATFGVMQFRGGYTYPFGTDERRGWTARLDERL